MRLGLCCLFKEQDIHFHTTTATSLFKLDGKQRIEKLQRLARQNAAALYASIEFCASHDIGCFRINSQILPLKTHPKLGYSTALLDEDIVEAYRRCGELAGSSNLRLSFHPDQFVVLSSPDPSVVKNSIAELEYQAEVAEWIGADVINVHAGGGYGDKASALKRLQDSVAELSKRVRSRLSLENDDRIYTPSDLLPICEQLALPLVYDVHHHRCHADGLNVETATELAIKTWNREPLFHVSSPRDGWHVDKTRPHSDYIRLSDFPHSWDARDITVEVEAKAKELAVLSLKKALAARNKRRGTKR